MSPDRWYELRVDGSAGTQKGIATGTKEGIVIGENGRLCSIESGKAMKFGSEQEAIEYLGKTTVPDRYIFETVCCQSNPSSSQPVPASPPPAKGSPKTDRSPG